MSAGGAQPLLSLSALHPSVYGREGILQTQGRGTFFATSKNEHCVAGPKKPLGTEQVVNLRAFARMHMRAVVRSV